MRVNELNLKIEDLRPYADLVYSVDLKKINSLVLEIEKYKVLAADTIFNKEKIAAETCAFFILHRKELPIFFEIYQLIALSQPSNCCSERANSVFSKFDFNSNCLQETIESSTICRFNNRKVKK